VRKIKEVLRLKFDVGLGLRQIARSCSIGLGTAHEYLHRAEAAKIAWPLGPEWDDDRLEAALFGGPPRSRPTVLARPESTSTITSRSTRTATACLTTSFKNWWRSARRRRSLRSFTRASVWRHTCVHTVMVTPSRLPSTVRVPTKRILNGHRRRMVHWAQTIGPTPVVCSNAFSPTSRTRRWATDRAWASFGSPISTHRLVWKPRLNGRCVLERAVIRALSRS
jgi:hypothetical protein